MELADLRRDFGKYAFDLQQTPENPGELFSLWLKNAAELAISELNAMVLSTVSMENKPSSRVVLLKAFKEGQFVFYTHYESRKGTELELNPQACLLFFWKELERQVRIEGKVDKIPYEQSNRYFKSRPRESQLNAVSSPQSKPISGIEEIDEIKNKLLSSGQPIECPPFWGGYALTPEYYEFWQGGPDRLHRRLSYFLKNGLWTKQMLAP
ncbi:MAG: pyridoxamine 5'-phosphate oxidase [Bacteroidales bacterium]|nr:pyridoxamine 5'-phosphate oxidase [Bacteroidales bacterium]